MQNRDPNQIPINKCILTNTLNAFNRNIHLANTKKHQKSSVGSRMCRRRHSFKIIQAYKTQFFFIKNTRFELKFRDKRHQKQIQTVQQPHQNGGKEREREQRGKPCRQIEARESVV